MNTAEFRKETETLGALETSILYAHIKFFMGDSEVHDHLGAEESVLYDSVIKYFRVSLDSQNIHEMQ
jgi:hypothetical protein